VHISSGATAYQTQLLDRTTGLSTTDSTWTFDVGDWTSDGVPDLFAIRMSGSGCCTEVHIWSGSNQFQGSPVLDVATMFPWTNATYWSFATSDYDANGIVDLYVIKKQGANSKTELHVLAG
jgi:hypothetical protein